MTSPSSQENIPSGSVGHQGPSSRSSSVSVAHQRSGPIRTDWYLGQGARAAPPPPAPGKVARIFFRPLIPACRYTDTELASAQSRVRVPLNRAMGFSTDSAKVPWSSRLTLLHHAQSPKKPSKAVLRFRSPDVPEIGEDLGYLEPSLGSRGFVGALLCNSGV